MNQDKIETTIKSVEGCANCLFKSNMNQVQGILGDMIQNINAIYLHYINNAGKYKEYEIDIPVQVLLSQMQNLIDAIDNKDMMQMADSLWYEIREGLLFFKDIESELSKQ